MKPVSDVSEIEAGLHNYPKSAPCPRRYVVGKKKKNWFQGEMSGFHPKSVTDLLCKLGLVTWVVRAQFSYVKKSFTALCDDQM